MTVLAPAPRPAGAESPFLPREDPIARLPILILYPHSRCNCRCLMCDIWRDRRKEELTAEDVAFWLPEWRALGVERVVLSGGEALLHSHLWDFCELLRRAGIGITLLSTGLLLARDAGRLVQYCDDVVVSLDGPRDVHDRIRNLPRAFEKLAEGVAAVRSADPRVAISGRCVVQRENFLALRATVATAREVGLDRISFLAADVTSEAFNRPGGWDRERADAVAFAAEDLPLLATEIDAMAEADFRDGFIAESREKLRRRLHDYFAALAGGEDFPAVECNAPWVSAVVESDGTVRPCFFQPPLGNLRESDGFAAVLNSPAAIAWRRGLDVARNEICRRCVCSLALREGEMA
jgi:radical SAM protein with 4Fe4S-binding SPASM domain